MPSQRKTRGPGRTTRDDWMQAALALLIAEGVESVKILRLADQLDCARSSFYWFFKDRGALLEALLEHWETTNTSALIAATRRPSDTITQALGHLYATWEAPGGFDTRLDFAIRGWASRDPDVRARLSACDDARIAAMAGMFERHGFAAAEADVRGRIVYFTQIGYATVDQQESAELRASRGRDYVTCLTGQEPREGDLALAYTVLDQLSRA
ncbi:TetR/AcrR family transcriptional regulator [Pararhodobacter zhoushanensis]|uniref:TetR/AcrR family transcriptional regulator n=1 Tax=Pararhodobacter zhoushanensis TaxID=2479545 RepID=A0ABT3H265_9RHOB|nr:TetR/AcrR family transcriptional regulator [Pararhodobacter zhoushanensis]MCW1933856.1 TetR/AcrR family transcriptional regulator [Pararhodobacter zhoushanensis]